MSGSILLSLVAIGVSLFSLENSTRQRKIAKEAHRLNLYQRRFTVYESAVRFAEKRLIDPTGWDWELTHGLDSAIRESKFLFDPEDQIEEILTDLRNSLDRGMSVEASTILKAHELLRILEHSLRDYLNFQQISVDEHKSAWSKMLAWLQNIAMKFRNK